MGRTVRAVGALAAVALVGACSAKSSTATAHSSGRQIAVLVAENFWGSIASQLGGDHAAVTSIITSPSIDPHTYEATAQDGRAIAGAQYVIFNGRGYDA